MVSLETTPPASARWLLHVDMDAFFASIEQRDHPPYRGKPVMVGSPPDRRGIIATCSYEARRFGVRSAMPSRMAGKLCPHGIFLAPDPRKYRSESRQIMKILSEYSPSIEPVSIDEAFLDVSMVRKLLGPPVEIAREIKIRIYRERGLTASIGVASNKFLAKLASDLEKPDGLTVIEDHHRMALLAPLPIGKLWGVGKVTQRKLEAHGFKTIGDIQKSGLFHLKSLLGSYAEHLKNLASGSDERPVEPRSEAKSIGSEHTFDQDTSDFSLLKKMLFTQSEEVAGELRKAGLSARTLALKLRYADFTTIARQTTLEWATQDELVIYQELFRLLANEKIDGQKIRLIGLSASHLEPPSIQFDLFDCSLEKRRRLASAVDAIRARHGPQAIRRLAE